MNRMTPILTGVASTWLGVLMCIWAYDGLTSPDQSEQPITQPSLEAIRALSELTVLEVDATEVVTTSLKGYTGSTSVVVLVNGTLTYGVDLDQARTQRTNQTQQHLVVALPQPKVRDVIIHHGTSQVLRSKRSGLWQLAIGPAREDEVLMTALAIGHDRFMSAATRDDLVSRAKRHAEAALAQFVSEMGWAIEIRWEP